MTVARRRRPARTRRARIAPRLLLIQGERKRAVFEQAVAAGDRQRWPVLVTLDSSYGTPLDVHWCA